MNSPPRTFFRQTLRVGPMATLLLLDTEDLYGQADCTLPKPKAPTRFIPDEPKIVERTSAAEIAASGRAAQLKHFRDARGMVQAAPHRSHCQDKQIAQHCINCSTK